MENIGTRVIYSGFWSLGSNWLSKGLGLMKMVILARLLSPLDFGILGLATSSLNILNVFSETGMEQALIQKEKIRREELDTAWTLSLVRGGVLFVLLFLGSGGIASYFHNATLKPVLRVMAVTFLLGGWTNIGIVFFQKELAFKKKALLEFVADIGGTVGAIAIGFWLRNVWALVAGAVIWGAVKCLFSYKVHDYRPRVHWNWAAARPFLSFGKYFFWISVITFIITNADNVLVGKLLDLTMLGFYAMAFNIANIPVTSLTGVMSQVFFPAYAKIQNDPERIKEAFRKTFDVAIMVLMPLTSMMIILAPGFTSLVLGKKWLPMIPALQALCFFGLFRGISSLFYPLHLALNRPDIQAKIKSLDLVTFIVLVYPCTVTWGILGTAGAMAVIYLINMVMNMALTVRLTPLAWKRMGKSVIVPLVMSLLIIIISLFIQSLKLPFGDAAEFVLVAFSCFGLIILILAVFGRKMFEEVTSTMKILL